MVDASASLFAVCEGTGAAQQVLEVLFAIGIVLAWLGLAWLCVWKNRSSVERIGLALVAVASAIAGSLVLLCFHDDLEVLLLVSVAIVVAIGIAAALFSKRFDATAAIAAALLGDALLPLVVLAVLAVHVSVGPGCLGDELG